MFTRKADFHCPSAPRWCAVAIILCSAAVAAAQFGGGGGGGGGAQAPGPANEQRLFPNGLPKMETMLMSALEHHPEVLVARSKLRAAEAEQRQAEFKALKDIMEVRDRWERANQSVAAGVGGTDPTAVRERLATLAAVEWELAFLLGTRGTHGEPASAPKGAAEKGGNLPQTIPSVIPFPAVVDVAIPRGEQAEDLKKRLGQQITLSLESMPLAELVKFLGEQSGLRFVLDKQALEEHGFPADSPIEVQLGELELGATLQVLEDLHKPLYFVFRDYGILVTTENYRSSKTVSVYDFWKLTDEELREKLRQQRAEELNNPGGMMGGGTGGGMF